MTDTPVAHERPECYPRSMELHGRAAGAQRPTDLRYRCIRIHERRTDG